MPEFGAFGCREWRVQRRCAGLAVGVEDGGGVEPRACDQTVVAALATKRVPVRLKPAAISNDFCRDASGECGFQLVDFTVVLSAIIVQPRFDQRGVVDRA